MGSENARQTAKDVSESIRKGKRVVLGKIIEKRYSKSTSKSPQRVTKENYALLQFKRYYETPGNWKKIDGKHGKYDRYFLYYELHSSNGTVYCGRITRPEFQDKIPDSLKHAYVEGIEKYLTS